MKELTTVQRNKIKKIIKYNDQIIEEDNKLVRNGLTIALMSMASACGAILLMTGHYYDVNQLLGNSFIFGAGSFSTVMSLYFAIGHASKRTELEIKKTMLEEQLKLVPDYDINQLAQLVAEPIDDEKGVSR